MGQKNESKEEKTAYIISNCNKYEKQICLVNKYSPKINFFGGPYFWQISKKNTNIMAHHTDEISTMFFLLIN